MLGMGGRWVGWDAAAAVGTVINRLSVTLTAKEKRREKEMREGERKGKEREERKKENAEELSRPGFAGWRREGRTL